MSDMITAEGLAVLAARPGLPDDIRDALSDAAAQLADAKAAQAMVVERAADGLVNAFLHMRATYAKEIAAVTPFDPLQAFYEKEVVWSAIGDARDAIRALDTDGLALVQALRAERDEAKRLMQARHREMLAADDLMRKHQRRAEKAIADRDRLAAANAALEAKLARLVGALPDRVEIYRLIKRNKVRQHGAIAKVVADHIATVCAALAEVQARDEGAKG
jgi:hypothetical protein